MLNSRKMVFGRYDYASFSSLFTYASASVVVPVALVALSKDLGFDLEAGGFSAGGALGIAHSMPIVLTMLLTGFLAGKYGKRKTLGFSALLMGLGMMLCSFASSYNILFATIVIASLGEGVIEALATPFVNDLHQKEAGRYVNVTHSFWSVGVLFTVITSGILLTVGVNWRVIIFGVGVIAIIPTLLLLLPEKQGKKYPEHPEPLHWKTVSSQSVSIMKNKRFWLFFCAMFVAGGGEFCLTFWCASYIQLTFTAAAWTGGVGTGLFAGGMIIGRMFGGYFIKQHHLRALIIYSAIVGVTATVFFPITSTLWVFFALLFISGVATAPFWPSIQTYAVDRIPKEDSTMMYILLSCAGIPGCGFFTWLLGYISALNGSITKSFYLIPACFIFIIAFIGIDYILYEKNRPDKIDNSFQCD